LGLDGLDMPIHINYESIFFLDLILKRSSASYLSAARTFLPILDAATSPSSLILSCKSP
jgi:hypothetical protein